MTGDDAGMLCIRAKRKSKRKIIKMRRRKNTFMRSRTIQALLQALGTIQAKLHLPLLAVSSRRRYSRENKKMKGEGGSSKLMRD